MPLDQSQFPFAMDTDPATGLPIPKSSVTLTGSNVGYSTDTKPTSGNRKGDTFLELDTKNVYVWDSTQWVLF